MHLQQNKGLAQGKTERLPRCLEVSVYLVVTGEGRALGSWVQKSCRAERPNSDWPRAAALHSAAAASKIPLGNPKGWRAQGQCYVSKTAFLPDSHPPFACVDSGAARVSPTPGAKQLGIRVLRWRPRNHFQMCWRAAGLGLAPSGMRAASLRAFPNRGCSGGKANAWRVNFYRMLGLR